MRTAIHAIAITFLLLFPGCSEEFPPYVPDTLDAPRTFSGKVVLCSDRQLVIPVNDRPYYEYSVLQNKRGQTWVIWDDFKALRSVTVSTVSSLPTTQQVLPKNWKFVKRCIAVMDASDNPCVIWSGFDDVTGEAIAASHWTGGGWATPIVLDRLPPCELVDELVSIMDSAGRIHVVYDRPLEPYEQYARGSIVVEGEFPNKCFHVMFDGKTWSKPCATTGKGRFCAVPLSLTIDTKDRLLVGAYIDSFSGKGESFLGCQTWDGRKWSILQRLTEKNVNVATREGGLLMDKQSSCVIWWRNGAVAELPYTIMIEQGKHTLVQPFAPLARPRFAIHPSGRIIAYWACKDGGELRVWKGERWSTILKCHQADNLSISSNGSILVSKCGTKEIRIQEISLKDTTDANPVLDAKSK